MNEIVSMLGRSVFECEFRESLRAFLGDWDEEIIGNDTYIGNQTIGLDLLVRDSRVYSIMLLPTFSGEIFKGISFSDSLDELEGKLGISERPKSTYTPFQGGRESNWVKYRLGEFDLHVEFTSPALVEVGMITFIQHDESLGGESQC